MSPYLLIGLLLLVALSPLLSIMPTRRQRQLANLRQAAASAGLYVRFDKTADEAERPSVPGSTQGDGPRAVLYGCRRERGDARGEPGVYRRDGEDWLANAGRWSPERLKALAELPGGVSEIRDEMSGIAVLWDEQGEAEDVREIARVLRSLLGRKY